MSSNSNNKLSNIISQKEFNTFNSEIYTCEISGYNYKNNTGNNTKHNAGNNSEHNAGNNLSYTYAGFIIKNNIYIQIFDELVNLYTDVYEMKPNGKYYFTEFAVKFLKYIQTLVANNNNIPKKVVGKHSKFNNIVIIGIEPELIDNKFNIVLRLSDHSKINYSSITNNNKISNTKNISEIFKKEINLKENFNELLVSNNTPIIFNNIDVLLQSVTNKNKMNKFNDYNKNFYKCTINISNSNKINGYIMENALYVEKKNMMIQIVPQIIFITPKSQFSLKSEHKYSTKDYEIYQYINNIIKVDKSKSSNGLKKFNNSILRVNSILKYDNYEHKILDIKTTINNNNLEIKAKVKDKGRFLYINVDSPKISFIHSLFSNVELRPGNIVNTKNGTNTNMITTIKNIDGRKYAVLRKNPNINIPLNTLTKSGEKMLKIKNEVDNPIIKKEGYIFPTKKYNPGTRVTLTNKADKLYYIKNIDQEGKIRLISRNKDNDSNFSNEFGFFKEDQLTSAENIKKGDIVVLKNDKNNYINIKKHLTVTDKSGQFYKLSNGTIKPKDQIFKIMTNPSTFVSVEEQKKRNNIMKKSMLGTITGLQKHARVVFKDNEHTNQLYYIDSLPDSKHVRLYSKINSNTPISSKVNGVFNINSISNAGKIEKGDVVIIGSKGTNFKNKNNRHQVTEVKGNICTLDNGKKYTSNELFKIYSAPKKSMFSSLPSPFTTKKKNSNNIKNYITYKGRQYTIEKKSSIFSSKYILKNLSGKTIEVSKKEFENDQKKEPKKGIKGRT